MASLRIPVLVVSFLVLAGAASIALPALAGATATFGTREQLRQCLDQGDALKARWSAIEAATVDNNKVFDVNDAEDAKLVQAKAALDRSDKNAILAFNKSVQEHALHVQQANQASAGIDERTKAWNADKTAVDGQCSKLTYRPADIDAVNKERKKAAVTAAASAAAS